MLQTQKKWRRSRDHAPAEWGGYNGDPDAADVATALRCRARRGPREARPPGLAWAGSLFLALACSGSLLAQKPSAEIPPPSPPFIATPPEPSKWTIVVTKAKGDSSGAPVPEVQTTATHSNGLENFIVNTGGKNQEFWYFNNLSFTPVDNDPSQIVPMAAPGSGPMPDGSLGSLTTGPGFPGFWWLGPASYKDVVKYNGRTCYHYLLVPAPEPAKTEIRKAPPTTKVIGGTVFTSEEESPSTTRVKPLEAEAWIDVETKLPVAIRTGGLLHTYTFLSPPTSMLALPPAMVAALDLQSARAQRLKLLEKRR